VQQAGCTDTGINCQNLKTICSTYDEKRLFLDEILQIISDSTNVVKENAAECHCSAICNKYEDAFASVAENRGIASSNWKMEASKVEAMLNEAGVNWSNARILFRHMKQFFGRSLFD
jgi:hypothetical protein